MIAYVPAYVDESGRTRGCGLYVMAAVVVPAWRADAVRVALREGLPRGLRRYHWRDEGTASRAAMVCRVRDLGLDAIIVTTSPVEPRRTERARGHCLLRLLWELDQRGIHDVVFESRQHGDRRDRQVIGFAQRAGHLRGTLRYGFGPAVSEPLLWLGDVVAGAATRAYGDADTEFLDVLGNRITDAACGGPRGRAYSWRDFTSRNSSSPNFPSSRPLPDCL